MSTNQTAVNVAPPTLLDGSPLSDTQRTAFFELYDLLLKTISTGKSEVPNATKKENEEKLHAGAAFLSRGGLSATGSPLLPPPTPSVVTASPITDGEHEETYHFAMDPKTLRRYLIANRFDVKKAYEAVLLTVTWRLTDLRETLALPDPFADCSRTLYMQWIGHDRQNRPCLLIRSRNADLEIPRDRRLRYLMIALERGITLMSEAHGGKEGVEQWNMIIDETDKEMRHMDNKFIGQISPVLFGHYVERLKSCYIINPGWLTQAVLTVVKFFMDERTKHKIHSYYGDKSPTPPPQGAEASDPNAPKFFHCPVPKLVGELGEENTPVEYGGTKVIRNRDEYGAWFNALPFPVAKPPLSAVPQSKPTHLLIDDETAPTPLTSGNQEKWDPNGEYSSPTTTPQPQQQTPN